MLRFTKILLPLLALAVSPARADTYYIDGEGGRDTNNGLNPSSPWKTVDRVNRMMRSLRPGDAVLFKRGSWFRDADLIIRASGENGRPVVFGAYGEGAPPHFEGVQVLGRDRGLRFVTVEDLRILGADTGIGFFGGNSAHIMIRNCIVDCSRNNGIFLSGIDTYTVEGNAILNSRNSGIVVYGSSEYPARNGIIRRNRVDGCGRNDGITLHMSDGEPRYDIGPHHLLENNVCLNCREQGIDVTSGSHIILRSNETFSNGDSSLLLGNVEDVVVENHFSHDELNTGIIIGGVKRLSLTGSVVYNYQRRALSMQPITRAREVKVLNNTLVAGPRSGGELVQINVRCFDLVFQNNIFCSVGSNLKGPLLRFVEGATAGGTKSRFSSNIWWRDSTATVDDRIWWNDSMGWMAFPDWSGLGQGVGSLMADPGLIAPDRFEFGLRPGSPCIDRGIDVGRAADLSGTKIPQGRGVDLGAFEYVPEKIKNRVRRITRSRLD